MLVKQYLKIQELGGECKFQILFVFLNSPIDAVQPSRREAPDWD